MKGTPRVWPARAGASSASALKMPCRPIGVISIGEGCLTPKMVVFVRSEDYAMCSMCSFKQNTSRVRTVALTNMRGTILYFSKALRLARFVEDVPALPEANVNASARAESTTCDPDSQSYSPG